MSNIKERKKKLAQQTLENREHIKEYEALVEESKKIVTIKEQEYVHTLENLKEHIKSHRGGHHAYVKPIILRLGEMLERYQLEQINKISGKLKRDLKGSISRGAVYKHALDKWKDDSQNMNPSGINRATKQKSSTESCSESKPLTEYEQEYVKVYEEKAERNEHILALIDNFLGMSAVQQAVIKGQLPKSTDHKKVLIEQAEMNMYRIVKALNDPDIPALIDDIRFLKQILSKVSEMAYSEQQSRKRNNKIGGI